MTLSSKPHPVFRAMCSSPWESSRVYKFGGVGEQWQLTLLLIPNCQTSKSHWPADMTPRAWDSAFIWEARAEVVGPDPAHVGPGRGQSGLIWHEIGTETGGPDPAQGSSCSVAFAGSSPWTGSCLQTHPHTTHKA